MRTLWQGARVIHRMMDRRAGRLCMTLLVAILAVTLLPMKVEALLPLFLGETTTRRDLKTIMKEAKAIQDEFKGKSMPAEKFTALQALIAEGKEIQDEFDREKAILGMQNTIDEQKALDEVASPALPGGTKTEAEVKQLLKNRIAGYISVGDFVALSPQLKKYIDDGGLQTKNELVFKDIPNLLKIRGMPSTVHQGLIPISREMRKQIEAVLVERKDFPVFGTRVIEPERLGDIVNETENDVLRLRDLLNVVTTTSPVIEWIKKNDFTRAADIVSDGDLKPEAAAEFSLESTTVKTIAVWIPVTEQQLQDAPVLINLIQQDLLYDVKKVEEEKIVWATGAGQDWNGLVNQISAGRTSGGDSMIDKIRRSMTDIAIDGYRADGIGMHPIDLEEMQLTKGTDGHYIYVVVTDSATGQMRIWGLRVAESVGLLNPAGTDRVVIVGDWSRGATLYDRRQASIAIGYKDDDFIRNIRTIRAEERVAFAVRRPSAFRKIVTLP